MLAAYHAGWAAFLAAAKADKPDSPALAATMIDPLLKAVYGELIREHYQGSLLEGDVELNPRVLAISGTTATVMDCTYDSTEYVYASNGSPVPPVTSPHHAGIRSTLTNISGAWKVSDQAKDSQACSAT